MRCPGAAFELVENGQVMDIPDNGAAEPLAPELAHRHFVSLLLGVEYRTLFNTALPAAAAAPPLTACMPAHSALSGRHSSRYQAGEPADRQRWYIEDYRLWRVAHMRGSRCVVRHLARVLRSAWLADGAFRSQGGNDRLCKTAGSPAFLAPEVLTCAPKRPPMRGGG